ncbi:alpha-amylase family protein [Spirosoma sordidisoli]|uniref:Beta-galactosidase n=1 Tax=Spirosoma sordidisoli TaxID=2502893 RepID=A0A4Q2UPN7_9BACT|nr:alpha-amylase family protein [Spirosoma sordidisoli]RYC71673.1 beta-galactosidase [Spirosoma sordidisoli]
MLTRRDFLQRSSLSAAGALVAWETTSGTPLQLPTQPSGVQPPAGLRFRQVHLDYHTSELITDVGAQFDPDEFADTLAKARVNSVTCFGRCHHGYIYHDTKRFPERHHPHLKRNLLKEQIEACHKRNIRVPVYLTVQWDHFTAREHPEWIVIDEHGKASGTEPFDAGFYRNLDVNTPYGDFLKEYVADLFEAVPIDGLFFDIVKVLDSSNPHTIRQMTAKGMNPALKSDRILFYNEVMANWRADMSAFVRSKDRNATIFYNSGHVGPYIRRHLPTYSHLELESLPSGGWGYLHFPLTGRYARTLGIDFLGMTGKFHTSWGDFSSLKNKAALEFECFSMLALNGKCSIGDQLAPNGKIDPATYDLIGSVYSQVEQKEPYCVDARPLVDIGVVTMEEIQPLDVTTRVPDPMMGAIRMLQEGKHQFDVIDGLTDWSGYRVLILPDQILLTDALKTKLDAYLAGGGAVLASHNSGLTPDKRAFATNAFGVSLVGEAPYSPDFIVSTGEGVSAGLPATELVVYQKANEVRVTGATVLAMTNVPYFNRTYQHFVSHRHTPSSGKPGYPAIVQNGKVIYMAHPLFSQYAQNAPRWCRQLVLNALQRLLPDPLVRTPEAPTSLLATLNSQATENRRILHLLHYVPERRGRDFDVIEDVIPLYNVAVSVKGSAKRVSLAPSGTALKFTQRNGRVEFVVPALRGHQLVVLT